MSPGAAGAAGPAGKTGGAEATPNGKGQLPPKGPNGHSHPAFLAVCGHVNLDIQLQVKELPKAESSVPVLERRVVWGGTGANIARHAAGLGVPVRLWSRVGGDFPPEWHAALVADGVDLNFLDIDPSARTPACFVLTDLVERQAYCIDQAAMGAMQEHPPPHAFVQGLAPGAWVHLATGDPLTYAFTADQARSGGMRVALDPGQEMRFRYDAKSLEGLLEMCDAFFVNEPELRVACDLLRYGSAEQFLDHVPAVVVTRGAQGASLYRLRGKTVHLPAFPARVVDPTGAGDALRAGWYAALAQGADMAAALKWGLAAAALKVPHIGGQAHVLRRPELEAMLAKA